MRKIINYQLLVIFGPIKMEEQVIAAIKNEWEPLGGPSLDNQGAILQAIVKYETTIL